MWSSEYRLLTAKDASTYLGISLSTLNRIEKEGLLIPFRTPGGHRRYNRRILDEYLENSRQNPQDNHRSGSNGTG
jgi:excisionase family DNA binding protein